ncbi:MAG: hypothetical protein IT449_08680 [Phycisphaerales bacterium]|nr:hypothetical protein [Phycisphaerales bacterium]
MKTRIAFMCGVSFCATAGASIQDAQPPQRPGPPRQEAPKPTRKLFLLSESRSLGTLLVRPIGAGPDIPWDELADAKGQILVPSGHDIMLTVSEEGAADLSPLTDLKANSLQALSLRQTSVKDGDLRHLAALTGLLELDLRHTKIGDEGLKLLAPMQRLRVLRLADTEVTNDGMSSVSRLEAIEMLELPTQIDRHGLARLAERTKLAELLLRGNQHLAESDALRVLTPLKALARLDLSESNVSDAALAPLAELTRLEILDFSKTGLTDEGLRKLAKLRWLTRVNLTGTKVSSSSLPVLAEFRTLETLLLGGTGVGDEGLEALGKLTALRTLSLASTKVTDAGVARLGPLAASIEELYLYDLKLTDASCKLFERMPKLKRLVIRKTGITEEATQRLGEKLPKCAIVK